MTHVSKSVCLFLALGLSGASVLAASKKEEKSKAPSPATDTLKVDLGASSVKWKGMKVTGSHVGNIKVKEGSIECSGSELKGGSFAIDMSTIVNEDLQDPAYNTKLITHLKSEDFFSVEKFPTANFKITSVKPLKDSKDGSTHEITGDLSIKGQMHPLSFPAKLNFKDGTFTAAATMKVDRTKYDIRYGSGKFFQGLGDKLIYDDFELTVSLVAKK